MLRQIHCKSYLLQTMFLFVFHWSLLKIITFWTLEIPTRKNLEPTKYLPEKIWDPRNTHEKNFRTNEGTAARWYKTYETQDGTDPRNLAHSVLSTFSLGGVSTGICRLTVFWFMLVRYHKFKLSTQIEYTSFASVILWVFSCKKISE